MHAYKVSFQYFDGKLHVVPLCYCELCVCLKRVPPIAWLVTMTLTDVTRAAVTAATVSVMQTAAVYVSSPVPPANTVLEVSSHT